MILTSWVSEGRRLLGVIVNPRVSLPTDHTLVEVHGGLGVAVTTDVTALVLTKELVHRVTAELPTLRTFAIGVGSLLYVDPADLIAL